MLIDAAEGDQANKITAYLKQHGVTAIDYLICTHAHADHCGGMRAVIAAFPVRTLYSSVTSSSNGAFQRVMRAAETANLAITVPNVGDTFPLGSATVTVLGPQKHYSDVNNQSLILRVDYGSNAFLFTGDDVFKPVKVLSGGEKVRCMLSRMMLYGSNVLVLDQPTNHLDLESITAVNNGLMDFKGVVLFSSHDHEFVQTIANRIMVLEDGKLTDRLGTYEDYIASMANTAE